jgi:WD40 repeat protein
MCGFKGTLVSLNFIKTVSQSNMQSENSDAETSVARFHEVPVAESTGFSSFLKKQKRQSQNIKHDVNFIMKIVCNESLAKVLSSNIDASYIFFNVKNSFAFAEYSWSLKTPLSIAYFKDSTITCHDVNKLSQENMDTVIGFSTGDIVCYSPISGKYNRLNRNGCLHKHLATIIKWIPGSENLFVCAFEDGSLLIFDKDLEDQTQPIPPSHANFLVTKPPKNTKLNPRSYWKVSQKAVTSLSFAPDCIHIAITSMDGTLKIIDFDNEKLLDVYRSYFGGLLCSTWSPDGRYILAGGQDDLISAWSFRGRLMARFSIFYVRCQAHSSWVTSVSFDPIKSSDKTYRFASGGEDGKILLWDFSLAAVTNNLT